MAERLNTGSNERKRTNLILLLGGRGGDRFTFDNAWSRALVGGAVGYAFSSLTGDVTVLSMMKLAEIADKRDLINFTVIGRTYTDLIPFNVATGAICGGFSAAFPETTKALLRAAADVIKYDIFRKSRPNLS